MTLVWRSDAATGNWADANWLNGGASQPPAGNEILSFSNDSQPAMNNNLAGAATNRFWIQFLPGSVSRTISGTAINNFANYSTTAPRIYNGSSVSQTLSFPFAVSSPFMELVPSGGDLNINGNVVLNANQLRVTGNTGDALAFGAGAVISGSGSVAINQRTRVLFQSQHGYTGDTYVNAGSLQINSGSAPGTGTLRLGDTSGTADAALLLPSGATVTNSINVRAGSSGTKTIGSTAAAGTAAMTGNLSLDSAVTISNATGNTLNMTGVQLDLKNQRLTVATEGSVSITNTIKNSGGSGSLVKNGGGTLTLGGPTDNTAVGVAVNGGTVVLAKPSSGAIHTLNAASTVNAGAKLKLGGSGGEQLGSSCSVTVNSGGIWDFAGLNALVDGLFGTGLLTNSGAAACTVTVGQGNSSSSFQGTIADGETAGAKMALTKSGLGTFSLPASNTYSGLTRILSGRLATTAPGECRDTFLLAGSGSSILNVTAASPSSSFYLHNLSNSAAAFLEFNFSCFGPPSTAMIRVATNVLCTIGTPLSVTVLGGNFITGQFPLIQYGSLLGDGFSGFYSLVNLPSGIAASLVNNTAAKTIDLKINSVTVLTWDGGTSSWDTGSGNWKTDLSYSENAQGGCAVKFDDTLTGGNTNILLKMNVSPASITVNCSTKSYTFTNAYKITGYGNLTKNGTGKLTIANSGGNDFAGDTLVSAGVLEIQNGSALGSITRGTTISSGAALQISGGINTLAEPLTLSGTGIGSGGALRSVSGANTFSGPITLSGTSARINADAATFTLSAPTPIVGPGTGLILGGSGNIVILGGVAASSLTKDGTGTVCLAGTNGIPGPITVSAGTLQIDGTNVSASPLSIAAGATLVGGGSNTGPVVVTGIIAPGTSIGTLRSGPQIWNSGGRYTVEMSNVTASAGSGWDLLAINGGVDVRSSAGAPFTIKLVSLANNGPGPVAGFDKDAGYLWPIATLTESVTNFDPASVVLDTSQFQNDLAGGALALETNGALYVRFQNNHGPVAVNASFTRASGTSLKIAIADLLATFTSDQDGDERQLVSLGTPGAGGTLSQDGTWVYYTPPAGDGDDTFSYTVRDARSYRAGDTVRTASATISISKVRTAATARSITAVNGVVTVNFAGIPGYIYDIERSTDLETWELLRTITNPPSGVFPFTDDSPPASAAFYRLKQH